MAKIIIQCENCSEEREVDEKMAGSTLSCAGCGETIRIPIPDIGEGVVLGGFVLEKQLGFGAMGEVWLAHQQAMDRKVALKLLSREFTMDSQFVDRFLKEVRLSAKMDHPNIITAFDAGCDKDIHYLAITFIDGIDLDQRLGEVELLPEKEALKITREISSALCYAWNDFKILHRDIKPSNIMIDQKGSAKLMDMGISKSTNEEAQLTMTGTVIGTPYYMSPEQGMGEKALDCRSDIYSLGATLYHLVTGALPFEATTAIGIISKHITEPLPSPQNTNPNLSDQCTALLEIMMAKGTDDRQQTWEEVIADIDSVLAGKMPTSKHRPEPGDSVVMRAITDEDLPASSQPTVVLPEPEPVAPPVTSSQTTTASQALEQPLISPVKKSSKGPLVVILSVAAILALVAAALLVFSGDDEKVDQADNIEHDLFPDERVPDPEPIAVQPEPVKHQTQANPQPHVDPHEKRNAEMWKFAAKFAKENPKNFDVAINNFEEISRTAGGSKYKMMADVEISKLDKAKQKAIKIVMDNLAKRAKPHVNKKNYNLAANVYEHYMGPFDQETIDERIRIANEYLAKNDDIRQRQQEQENRQRQEMRDGVSRILDDIIKGDIKDAKAKLQIVSKKLRLPGDIREPLEQLLNLSKNISESFTEDIGKKITIKTSKGPVNVTVQKVKGSIVYIEEKRGKFAMVKRLALSKLSEDEIIKRSGMNPFAEAMYKSLKAAKAKNFNDAKRFAEEISGELGEIFGEAMGRHYMPQDMQEDNKEDNRLVKHNKQNVEPNNNHNEFHNEPDDGKFQPNKKYRPKNKPYNKAFGEVHRKIKNIDPSYNGRARIMGQHGMVEEVDLFNCNGQGINNKTVKMLAKLPDLKFLDLAQTRVTDITPLAKTKIHRLILARCDELKDLSPLAKIKTLRELSINNTRIEDISHLKGLKLEMLDISRTRVGDISVLKGMPIRELRMMNCAIQDYSVLKTLKNLQFLQPIDLWRQIPGKEHMANRRQMNNQQHNQDNFDDNRNDNFQQKHNQ